MVQPISAQQLFPGVDVLGLEPNELAQIHTVLNKLREGRAKDKAQLLAEANRVAIAAGRIKEIPNETMDLINESLKDPIILSMLENEALASAGQMKREVRRNDESHGTTTVSEPLGSAVRCALRNLFEDDHSRAWAGASRNPARFVYRPDAPRRFPVFDAIAQSFLGVSGSFFDAARKDELPDELRRVREEKVIALTYGLERGLRERKQLLERDPGASPKELRMAFEGTFVSSFLDGLSRETWKDGYHVDSAINYAGNPQDEAERISQQGQDLIRKSEEIQDATLEEAVGVVRAKKEQAMQQAKESAAAESAAEPTLEQLRELRRAEAVVVERKEVAREDRSFLGRVRKALS